MLSELLQKLETEHGISPEQGSNILNTIAGHIKEKFPMVGGMIDNLLGTQTATTDATGTTTAGTTATHESTLQQLEDMAKSKLGGLFGS